MKIPQVLILATIALFINCKSSKFKDFSDGIFADIETNKGDIIVKLEYEKTPVTVANFISLAEGSNTFVSDQYKGKKYYNGILFHRVMKDFMIQGGDPTATGSGNPGYKFQDEFNDSLRHDKAGVLSMANSGPKTNGSQFFITHKETPFLDGKHTVFGEVISGMDVVDSIANVPTSQEAETKDRPIKDVVINTVEIIRVGKQAKQFDAPQILTDYFAGEKTKIAEMQATRANFISELNQQAAAADSLASGLRIFTLQEGQGDQPKTGQKVWVEYAGWLADGTLFDTTNKDVAEAFGKFDEINAMHRGDFSPSMMDYTPDSRLISGFREGLLKMKVGDKVRLFIPSHLGFGPQGGGPIPPNSDLVFDIEITGIAQ